MDGKKPVWIAVLKYVLGAALISAALIHTALFFISEIQNENATRRTVATLDVTDPLCVLLNHISMRQYNVAIEEIERIQSNANIPSSVKAYLRHFSAYYNEKTGRKKRKSDQTVGALFFIYYASDVKNYLASQKIPESEICGWTEIIPYCCIVDFEENPKNNKSKNKERFNLCEQYLDSFVRGNSSVSEKGANIICLDVQAMCKSNPQKDQYLAQVVLQVDSFRNDFSRQLGEGGTFVRQRNYLENIRTWSVKKKNKSHPGKFPEYIA